MPSFFEYFDQFVAIVISRDENCRTQNKNNRQRNVLSIDGESSGNGKHHCAEDTPCSGDCDKRSRGNAADAHDVA